MSAVVAGSKRDQIITLLTTTAMKPSEIAWAVSCDQGYINQLLDEPEVAHTVAKARMELLSSFSKRDQKYDDLEDKLLAGLELKLEQGPALMKMETLLRAIQTVNNAKRRGTIAQAVETPQHAIVNLTIPVFVINQFKTDSNNQVTQVGDRAMISMPAQNIMKTIKEHANPANHPVLEDKTNDRTTPDVARQVEAATISAGNI